MSKAPAYPIQSLTADPSLHLPAFLEAVSANAAYLHLSQYAYTRIETGEALKALYDNPDSGIIAEPERPKPLTEYTAAQLPLGLALHQAFTKHLEARDTLAHWILEAVGPTIRKTLKDPTSHTFLTGPRDIIKHLRHNYGTPTKGNLRTINERLHKKVFSDMDAFTSGVPDLEEDFASLAAAGQPKSEVDKCEYLRNATKQLPQAQAGLHKYDMEVEYHLQSFKDMVAAINKHKYVEVTMGSAYAAAAHATPAKQYTQAQMDKAVREARASATNTTKAPHTATTKAPATATTKAPATTTAKYCFVHGMGHPGTKCRVMLADLETYGPMVGLTACPASPINGILGHS